jgi:transcriptional regulator with PAS, ATPase and Fis domain
VSVQEKGLPGFGEQDAVNNEVIAESQEMKYLLAQVYRIALYDSTVLITGESGVGKEVIANLIHLNSPRRKEPFIKVNCTAIPENLLESQFFGYEPGSFTGALRQGKSGIFEVANNGTVFLDEIGDLPMSLQGKLLRVLQEGEVMRIGGTKPQKVDVRIIAATNKDLMELISRKIFREDLYYRLNVIPVDIPPLRKRREDIMPLLKYFSKKYEKKFGLTKQFLPETLEMMLNYSWPGNVRELRNIVERLFVTTEPGADIRPSTLMRGGFLKADPPKTKGAYVVVHSVGTLKDAVEELERLMIRLAFQKYGSVQKVAKALGVDPSTIWRKRQKEK